MVHHRTREGDGRIERAGGGEGETTLVGTPRADERPELCGEDGEGKQRMKGRRVMKGRKH